MASRSAVNIPENASCGLGDDATACSRVVEVMSERAIDRPPIIWTAAERQ
jgi:hypothetical protein